ncbi:MAG: hypothetical protein AAF830_04545 [Pseudomonadota bacterium]
MSKRRALHVDTLQKVALGILIAAFTVQALSADQRALFALLAGACYVFAVRLTEDESHDGK